MKTLFDLLTNVEVPSILRVKLELWHAGFDVVFPSHYHRIDFDCIYVHSLSTYLNIGRNYKIAFFFGNVETIYARHYDKLFYETQQNIARLLKLDMSHWYENNISSS